MQCRRLVQNRRAKCFNALALKALLEVFLRCFFFFVPLEQRSRADVCPYVCPSVQAFSPLEIEQLIRSGRASIRSMRRSGGKTMVPVADQSVACGRCHVQSCKRVQKSIATRCRPNQWTDSAQTRWADRHHGGM